MTAPVDLVGSAICVRTAVEPYYPLVSRPSSSPLHSELDLHIDLAYYESPPGIQLLHCRQFDDDVTGGESTFMDGIFAAEELRRRDYAAFRTLLSVPATFQKVHFDREQPVHIVARRPHIVIDTSVGLGPKSAPVTAVFWAPPFEGPLRVDTSEVRPYYEAYGKFAALLKEMEAERQYLVEFRVAVGEVLTFNNRRMLHGRRHFFSPEGAPGRRCLQGTYVNADDALSRLRTLVTAAEKAAVAKGRTYLPIRKGPFVPARAGNQQANLI